MFSPSTYGAARGNATPRRNALKQNVVCFFEILGHRRKCYTRTQCFPKRRTGYIYIYRTGCRSIVPRCHKRYNPPMVALVAYPNCESRAAQGRHGAWRPMEALIWSYGIGCVCRRQLIAQQGPHQCASRYIESKHQLSQSCPHVRIAKGVWKNG